jgi:hypothetical protein
MSICHCCDPTSTAIVDELWALGLFYGGVLIERGGGDVLRMQDLLDAHIAPDVKLISSQNGRDMLNFMLSDARDVAPSKPSYHTRLKEVQDISLLPGELEGTHNSFNSPKIGRYRGLT